jgi:hypothetical protein
MFVLPWLRCTCFRVSLLCTYTDTYMGARSACSSGQYVCVELEYAFATCDHAVSQHQKLEQHLNRPSTQLARPCSPRPSPTSLHQQPTNQSPQQKGLPSLNQHEHHPYGNSPSNQCEATSPQTQQAQQALPDQTSPRNPHASRLACTHC